MTPNIDDDFIETVRGLEERLKLLARASRSRYSEEVNSIIGTRSRDIKLIESCLDKLLNMCYDMAILQLFRRLCRYYLECTPK